MSSCYQQGRQRKTCRTLAGLRTAFQARRPGRGAGVKLKNTNDAFLQKRIENYDAWLKEGRISFSSRVIPVGQSLEARQWVLPTEQVQELLEAVDTIALQPCECRNHYQRCDHPREVCLLFDEVAEKFLQRNEARRVTLQQATEVLQEANRSGLVHLALYMPDHKVYALCSCCSCCCHDIQIVRDYGRGELMAQSQYVARTENALCVHCGECVARCVFGARGMNETGELRYEMTKCLGCGLCVTACPTGATAMVLREEC